MTDLSEGYFEVGGVRLHYVEAGAGPLIICYHGFPLFWFSWHHQMRALKDQFRVVALDGPGINLSSKPAELEPYRL
ncbi:MAG: alpha/beta fold hydrolase, partial [Pseudomonadota bacterium]